MKNLLIITQKVDKNDQLLGFFIEWLKGFSTHFGKITVLCLEKGEFDLPNNIKVISLGKDRHLPKILWLINFYKYICGNRKDYDAVFVHMNPVWMVLGGWCWGLLHKKRFLWYTSGGVTTKLKLAEKFADTIFTASSESFRLPSKKVIVTGHGIDTDLFRPNKELKNNNDQLKMLSVGRIAPVKNYGTLIEAAKILKNQGVYFSITIIGEAPLNNDNDYALSIKEEIRKYNLGGNFNFVGKIGHRELPKYYQSHDLFIHLSKTGSLDKAILEAMACGMTVLSSSDSAKAFLSTEMVFDENGGEELAKKIKNINSNLTREELRDYVVNNHNLEKLITKISHIINV